MHAIENRSNEVRKTQTSNELFGARRLGNSIAAVSCGKDKQVECFY